jgi:hypothetical protein
MSFVQSIVGFASQFLGRAERIVTYYAGLTTLDTQQFTLWADGRPDIAISGTENVTGVYVNISCHFSGFECSALSSLCAHV